MASLLMARFGALVGLAAMLALPMPALAQGGGACLFSGRFVFNSPVGVVPSVCQSPAGCDKFTLSGALSGPTCVGFDGTLSSRRGLVFGAHGCEGNVHAAVVDHSRFSGKPFSLYGVCVAGVCSGVGYTPLFGAITYELVLDPTSSVAVAGACAAGSLRDLPVVGVVAGAATN